MDNDIRFLLSPAVLILHIKAFDFLTHTSIETSLLDAVATILIILSISEIIRLRAGPVWGLGMYLFYFYVILAKILPTATSQGTLRQISHVISKVVSTPVGSVDQRLQAMTSLAVLAGIIAVCGSILAARTTGLVGNLFYAYKSGKISYSDSIKIAFNPLILSEGYSIENHVSNIGIRLTTSVFGSIPYVFGALVISGAIIPLTGEGLLHLNLPSSVYASLIVSATLPILVVSQVLDPITGWF